MRDEGETAVPASTPSPLAPWSDHRVGGPQDDQSSLQRPQQLRQHQRAGAATLSILRQNAAQGNH